MPRKSPKRDCPTCGAKAGQPCRAASGAVKHDVHVARRPPRPAPSAEPDPTKAPRFHRWMGARTRETRTFDAAARARVVEAIAAHGRIKLACALAGVGYPTVLAWRKRGQAQLRELEKHEAAQDRLAADPEHQRQAFAGPLEAAGFLLETERAAAWWEAQGQSRLQLAAEAGDHAITMWLLNRHDRLTGAVKGGEVHEHHHHAAPSAMGKLGEIVGRRKALRGGA